MVFVTVFGLVDDESNTESNYLDIHSTAASPAVTPIRREMSAEVAKASAHPNLVLLRIRTERIRRGTLTGHRNAGG